jgi:hypothetical protein
MADPQPRAPADVLPMGLAASLTSLKTRNARAQTEGQQKCQQRNRTKGENVRRAFFALNAGFSISYE